MIKTRKNSKPLVSIGFLAYNRDSIIREAVDSLLQQTYRNFELIISDDASSDRTQQICEAYEKKDSRVRYVRHEKRIGQSANFNYVLKESRGTYFMWACDDDKWDSRCIERFVEMLEKNRRVGLVVSNYISFNDEVTIPFRFVFKSHMNRKEALISFMNTNMMMLYGMYRRDILIQAGGYHHDSRPLFDGGSDNLTVIKVLLKTNLAFCEDALLYKRDSGLCLNRYEILKNKGLTHDVISKIQRYLFFPIIMKYDLIHVIIYFSISSFSLSDKIELLIRYIKLYITVNIQFIAEIMKGTYYLLIGMKKNKERKALLPIKKVKR